MSNTKSKAPWWRNIDAKKTNYDLGPMPFISDRVVTDEAIDEMSDFMAWKRVKCEAIKYGWWIVDARGWHLDKSGVWSWDSCPSWREGSLVWQSPEEAIEFYKAWLIEFMEKELASQRAKESEE